MEFVKRPNDGKMKGIAFIKGAVLHLPLAIVREHILLALYALGSIAKFQWTYSFYDTSTAKVRVTNADPDGYWIEILNAKASRDFVGWKG